MNAHELNLVAPETVAAVEVAFEQAGAKVVFMAAEMEMLSREGADLGAVQKARRLTALNEALGRQDGEILRLQRELESVEARLRAIKANSSDVDPGHDQPPW